MIPFQAPVDDILFSLNHIGGAKDLADWDAELAEEILGHFGSFAEGVIAPVNAIGDTQGARLENGRVRMPDGFDAAYAQLAEGGWQGLSAPEAFGGMDMSAVIGAGVSEIFSGANHSMQMVCNLVPGAIATLMRFGTDAQQNEWIPQLASGAVLSTMCLTEAGAGSDLSAIRCKAVPEADGWRIDGQKIFISGGDQDLSQGILHLVLARTGAPEDGIKGLSLFLCPAQAEVTVTRIEEKLGLHASPTCQMAFDGAKAELIGDVGAGLVAMFTVMNHARIDVALQGVAHADRAYRIARAYADERLQGRGTDGGPARLSDHADVCRMLDSQAALALGARGMCHIAQVVMEQGDAPELVAFLTPLCKVFCSDAGIRAADLGIQVLGGYGYLEEYGLSQVWRDARITAIYEGANGIHSRALATRGLRSGGGADAFADWVADEAEMTPVLADRLEAWKALRIAVAKDPLELADRFCKSSGALMFAAVWARIERHADHAGQPDNLRRLAGRVLDPDYPLI